MNVLLIVTEFTICGILGSNYEEKNKLFSKTEQRGETAEREKNQ